MNLSTIQITHRLDKMRQHVLLQRYNWNRFIDPMQAGYLNKLNVMNESLAKSVGKKYFINWPLAA